MGRKKLGPYEQALKDAACEMGRPTDDWLVEKLATLMIQLRLVRAKGWSANNPAHTGDVIALMDQITALRKEAGNLAPTKVQISLVESVQGIYCCEKCGFENHLEPDRYTPLVDRQTEAKDPSGGRSPVTTSPDPTMPLSATAVTAGEVSSQNVENTHSVVPKVERRSFHDPIVHPSGRVEYAPLKRLCPNDWHRRLDPADAVNVPDVSNAGLVR
jgi:hypothetical protein